MICKACQDTLGVPCARHARTSNHDDTVDLELDALRGEVLGLYRKLEETQAALARAMEVVCFFASVIKSGEAWSAYCEDAKSDAISATDPAAPAKEGTK